MKIKVQVVIESDDGDTKAVEKIACLERGMLRPAELGLTLDEAKDLLESMQHSVVEQQLPNIWSNRPIASIAAESR